MAYNIGASGFCYRNDYSISFAKGAWILGTKKDRKLLILVCVLLSACILVYTQRRIPQVVVDTSLKQFFSQIEGFETPIIIDMSSDAVNMLNLDDYFFADYKGPFGNANLYIGYYYSANKAYAAHSPLVCYPSQGWKIDSKPKKGTLQVGSQTIEFEEITTSLDGTKELVLYWYQAGLFTNTQIYKNKIDMGYNKLMNNSEQHGFVRVAIPITADYEGAHQVATNFIEAFYPHFVRYISQLSGLW